MENILIVSSQPQTAATLTELLERSATHITCAASGGEARRMALENSYDLLLINTPLSDEFGDDLSLFLTQKITAGAILIVRAEIAEEVGAKVEEQGIMVIPKPISKALLYQTVKLADVAQCQIRRMERENSRLQGRIEELRLVDRAKCALIQYRGMTEAQAHHYIEKVAMDERITRREVADRTLKTFE